MESGCDADNVCVCVPHVSLGHNASIVSQRAGALCRLDQGRLRKMMMRVTRDDGHCLPTFTSGCALGEEFDEKDESTSYLFNMETK